jgi:hypothetical protein
MCNKPTAAGGCILLLPLSWLALDSRFGVDNDRRRIELQGDGSYVGAEKGDTKQIDLEGWKGERMAIYTPIRISERVLGMN